MKKLLVMLALLVITVYLKPIAYMTYKGWGRFDSPYKIELKGDSTTSDTHGLRGITTEGKHVFIPWDSISYIVED